METDSSPSPSTSAEPTATPRKRRLRLSVGNLVLLTSLVGVGIVCGMSLAQLRAARTELRSLHRELGRLVVEDPDMINLIAIPELEQWRWRWRIYFPRGHEYRIRLAVQGVTGRNDEWPASDLTSTQLEGEGETLIELGIRRDLEGALEAVIATPTMSVSKASEELAWVEAGSGSMSTQRGGDGTEVHEADARFDLLRMQPVGATGVALSPAGPPGPGLLLWIEEAQKR